MTNRTRYYMIVEEDGLYGSRLIHQADPGKCYLEALEQEAGRLSQKYKKTFYIVKVKAIVSPGKEINFYRKDRILNDKR